jgi:glycosyltransferase involved in cell wall biosynthesis
MRHIALITTSYPEGGAGAEAAGSFVEDFATELSRHVRVTVLAASTTDSLCTNENLTVRRFSVPRLPLSLLNPLLPTHWASIVQTIRSGEKALQEVAKDDRPDHILALWALPSGHWANRIASRYGIKYSVWALGSDIWGLGKLPLIRSVLRRVLRRASFRFADGLQLAGDVQDISGMECGFLASTRLLPAVGNKAATSSAPFKLAFLGRWHPNKGADLLLDALGQLEGDDWERISEVRVFGGGPLQQEILAGVSTLADQGRPVVAGAYLDKQAAAELIHWADYLLLPSRIESIPVIFSDAMQVGTPIVATPVGDLPSLSERYRFGIVAAEANAPSFAKAIQQALGHDPAQFYEGILEARRDFDLGKIVGRFLRETSD